MVLVDGIVFTNDRQKGIQRYFFEMLSRAAAQVDVAVFLDERQRAPIPPACRTVLRPERFSASRADLHLWTWRRIRQKLLPTRLPQTSVFHASYFTRSPVKHVPEITTVYDMIFERLPYYYGPDSESDALQKAESVRSATRIVAISNSTATELAAFYPETRDRIVTIYPGSEHLPQPSGAPSASGAQRPYCLFVGYRFAYKNFTTVLDAMTCGGWDKDLELHVVGAPFLVTELMLIKRLGLAGRVRHLGLLSDHELAQQYASCAAFIFPSLCEGFGFPVLEAQSCGAPLVCSDIPVFREIAGTAVEFFDALDPSSLAGATNRCAGTRGAQLLVSAQRLNLARFSWDRCAAETIKLWNSVRR